jgi:hypothetical protein
MDRKHYQDRATECISSAHECHSPGERLQLLEIAQRYILLAAFVGARLDHGTAHRAPEQPVDQGIANDA